MANANVFQFKLTPLHPLSSFDAPIRSLVHPAVHEMVVHNAVHLVPDGSAGNLVSGIGDADLRNPKSIQR